MPYIAPSPQQRARLATRATINDDTTHQIISALFPTYALNTANHRALQTSTRASHSSAGACEISL